MAESEVSKQPLNEEVMQQIYAWVDDIPLTRPKRNITRDFSDGVMAAELVKHFFPKIVELHNYSTANSVQHKLYNWNTLNQKVFKRLNFALTKADIDGICNCSQGAIERALFTLKVKIEAKVAHKNSKHARETEAQQAAQSLNQMQHQQLIQQQQQIQQQIQLLQQMQLAQQPLFSPPSTTSSPPQNPNTIIQSYASQLPLYPEQQMSSKQQQALSKPQPAPSHLQQQPPSSLPPSHPSHPSHPQALPQQQQQQQQQLMQQQHLQQLQQQQMQQQMQQMQMLQQQPHMPQPQIPQSQANSNKSINNNMSPNNPSYLAERYQQSNGTHQHPPQQHQPQQQDNSDYLLIIEKKDQTIKELQSHVDNLQSRIMKLEQIAKIRDNKIQKLTQKLQQAGLA